MTTVLLCASLDDATPGLVDDLRAVGFVASVAPGCTSIVQKISRTAPDVVIFSEASPDAELLACIRAIAASVPRPVALFTADPDAGKIEEAMEAGVHAYVVDGYSRARLRSVIHLAQSRFRREQALRGELSELSQRFAERKLVDRAKGILMGARQLREEEAYAALRTAAMRTKRRIGQVSREVIEGARYAEAVNRAGQLRMLSQRLAKLHALAGTGTRPEETARLIVESMAQADANLQALGRGLSQPTFGDLLDGVAGPWGELKRALGKGADLADLVAIDQLAERLLGGAEVLTSNLEVSGYAAALHVINVAGRQRMLSQRLAKQALHAVLLPAPVAAVAQAAMEETEGAIAASLAYLADLPMSNAAIARELEGARAAWEAMRAALPGAGTAAGRDALAGASEAVLGAFERLTDHLERGIQAISA